MRLHGVKRVYEVEGELSAITENSEFRHSRHSTSPVPTRDPHQACASRAETTILSQGWIRLGSDLSHHTVHSSNGPKQVSLAQETWLTILGTLTFILVVR